MHHPSRPSRPLGSNALLLLLFTLLTFTSAAPIAQRASSTNSLVARVFGTGEVYSEEWYDNGEDGKKTQTWYEKGSKISQAEYETYLNYNYKNKDRYILFTGHSEDQVQEFQKANPKGDWNYYKNFFVVPPSIKYEKHPHFSYVDHLNRKIWREDDSEAYSRAIAKVAEKKILVFGGNNYKVNFPNSVLTRDEMPILHKNVKSGQLKDDGITHMAKNAKRPDQIMATEDGDGKFTYKKGFQPNTINSTNKPICKRGGECTAGSKGTADDSTKTAAGAKAPDTQQPEAAKADPKASTGNSVPYGDPAQYAANSGGSSTTAGDPAPAGAGSRGGAAADSPSGGGRASAALKGLGAIHW